MKRISAVFLGLLWIIGLAAVFGTITMLLWNALLPSLLGLPTISWLYAVGLLALCRVLFGGIGGLRGIGGFDHRDRARLIRGKWGAMSEEERKHLAEEIKKRHGFDFHGDFDHCVHGHNAPSDEKKDEQKD